MYLYHRRVLECEMSDNKSDNETDSESDSDDRRPLVNLRVNLRQKARWERYAKQSNEYTSLSHLIRIAVEKEMSEDSEEPRIEGEMVEVQTELSSLSEDLEQLQKDVSWLRSQEEHDIEELGHMVYDNLREIPSSNSDEAAAKTGQIAAEESQTIPAIARRLNSTPHRVGEAIEWCYENNFPVVYHEFDGERHWFKER